MTKFRWIIFSVLVVGFLAFLFTYSQKTSVNLRDISPDKVQIATDSNGQIGDHVYGKADSKVVLVNYSNYQCSFCAKFHPEFKKIAEDYKDKIAFVFRNISDSNYPNSIAASTAAEAAGLQGKFWLMHDIILESQDEWSRLDVNQRDDIFESYAKKIDLDINKFKADLKSSQISRKLRYDNALGKKHDIKGTPALYLNGIDIDSSNFKDFNIIRRMIDEEIKKAGI